MDIGELFLILAGFNTNDTSELDIECHPAARELVTRAVYFGNDIQTIRTISNENLDHPLAQTMKTQVELAYLEFLSDLESATIGKQQIQPQSDYILRIADIIANTVDLWEQQINFSLRILERLPESRIYQVSTLMQDILQYTGNNKLEQLGQACLVALDNSWLDEIKLELSECGERFSILELAEHPQIAAPNTLIDSYQAMRKLLKAAEKKPQILQQVLGLVEQNSRLLSQVETPFRETQLASVLKQIHQNINSLVRECFLRSDEMERILILLRKVVLFGSARFTCDYCDFNCDMNRALQYYFEAEDELTPEQAQLAPEIIHYSDENNWIQLEWTDVTSFMVTPEQWTVLSGISVWLAQITMANNAIPIGSGVERHAYKLFFNALWQYCQSCIDIAFNELNALIESDQSMNICAEMDHVIKVLVYKLLLDLPTYRSHLKLAISGSYDSNLDPLRILVEFLHTIPGRHSINLIGFNAI